MSSKLVYQDKMYMEVKLLNIMPKHGLGVGLIMLICHFAPTAVLVQEVDPGMWSWKRDEMLQYSQPTQVNWKTFTR